MNGEKSWMNYALSALGIVFLACVILIVFINNKTQTELFWKNQQDQLALIAENCETEIGDWIDYYDLIATTTVAELQSDRIKTREDYVGYLRQTVELNSQVHDAFVGYSNGESYYANPAASENADARSESWYLAGMQGEEEIVLTEPYLNTISGRLVISFLIRITTEDGLDGVFGIEVALDSLSEKASSLQVSPNGGTYLVSRDGKVMTYIDPSFLPKIENGKAVFMQAEEVLEKITVLETINTYQDRGIQIERILDYDGAEKYEATLTIRDAGWRVGINIPLSDYDEAVQRVIDSQAPVIIIAVVMAIISVLVAFAVVSAQQRNHEMQRNIEVVQAQTKTKSDFLSRMSHEMRTPMNAIIGMAKIAESTNEVSRLKYCLSTIETYSVHLLSIINDVLDMSKIEAGKLELEIAPFNIEKMFTKICNLVAEQADEKKQKLSITLGENMEMHYNGDELRLTQVLTNIIVNAIKFTPENGNITVNAEEVRRDENTALVRFSVADTGIGMTEEQIGRLFQSFEQADGSITRRFGGTGLGLVICKSIVEKMGGGIQVKSTPGQGSTFCIEVMLERSTIRDRAVTFGGVSPEDLKMLVVDEDDEERDRFCAILDSFKIPSDAAESGTAALCFAQAAQQAKRPYDVIFIDFGMKKMDGIETAKRLEKLIDRNTVIIMTSFLGWSKIEDRAADAGIRRFIAKPFFPSTILDAINAVVGEQVKGIDLRVTNKKQVPDLSGVCVLLAEDIDINREIFVSLMGESRLRIDTAENGMEAVAAFVKDPDKYDIIIMDIQMPEMDGFEATQKIRELDTERAKTIPIIAMTANVFKEDINRCLECGMNDHLAKPIDESEVLKKIERYRRK